MSSRPSAAVRPALALSSLASLALFAGLGGILALAIHPSPSFAGAPSAYPSGYYAPTGPTPTALPATAYCAPPIGPLASATPYQPPVTTHRGKITSITAGTYAADATVVLDSGQTMTVRLQSAQIPVALEAYQRKLTIDLGTRGASSCQVLSADWLKI